MVDSGERDGGANLGEILEYNDWPELPEYWWNTDSARQINGTDGSLLRPYISMNDTLTFYVTDICRLVFER